MAAVRRSPGNSSAWGQLGRVYQAHDYVELAESCYRTARRLSPAAAEWPYHLGFLAAQRGDTAGAVELFGEVVARRPDYPPVYYRLGNALVAEGRLDEAAAAYAELLARAPDQPFGHIGLGKVARRRGNLDLATVELEAALELDPHDRETLYLLAMTYVATGRRQESAALLGDLDSKVVSALDDPLMEAMQQQTRDSQALIQAANALLAQGERDRAESFYRRVLDADPDHYDALLNLGVLLGLTGRNDDAEAVLSRAATVDPDRADAHTMLAIAYFQTRRPELGLAALERALEIDPDHPRALEILATLEGEAPP